MTWLITWIDDEDHWLFQVKSTSQPFIYAHTHSVKALNGCENIKVSEDILVFVEPHE
jgi:hypothetical protein